MDVEILDLREKKYTIEQIAEKLGITKGQVKYRLYKRNKLVETVKKPAVTLPYPPLYYGENDIVVVIQGPSTLYVYWEITWPLGQLIGDFLNASFEHVPKKLRIYDVTDIWFDGNNAHWHRDIDIDFQADNWFIYELFANRTYIVDLGIIYDNRFIPIVRSKAKSTPQNQGQDRLLITGENECKNSAEVIKPHWFENFSTYTL